MQDVSLKALLEAGCHFGHRVERWHPKASQFIYQAREGIHIIDLAKTRDQLKKAMEYVYQLGIEQKKVLFIATKRQAKGIVADAAKKAGLPYMTNRWIGGYLTNWDQVKKNIDKINRMRTERTDGSWNKFPKHEIVKMEKDLRKLESVYGGVVSETYVPDAIFIVDVKKEIIAIKEAKRRGIAIMAIADTNADPDLVEFPIPANDDALGSIQCVIDYIVDAYMEGKALGAKEAAKREQKEEQKKSKAADKQKQEEVKEEQKKDEVKEKPAEKKEADTKEQEKPAVKKAAKKTLKK